MKNFSELTEQELLALAIGLEEEDIRTYGDLAESLHQTYPGTAKMFAAMAAEEEDRFGRRLVRCTSIRYVERRGGPCAHSRCERHPAFIARARRCGA